MCKFFGLAPYTILINEETGEGTIDSSFIKNLGGLVCTATLSICMMFGLFDIVSSIKLARKASVTDTLSKMFCMPMFFFLALASLLMNGTVIKQKIKQLLQIFSDIDKGIINLHKESITRGSLFSIRNILSHLDILVLTFVIIPYLIYDSVIWGIGVFFIHSYIMRISQLLIVITVMQYCKFVIYVWQILSEFCDILSHYAQLELPRIEKHIDALPHISKIHPEWRPRIDRDITEIVVALRRMYSQLCEAVHLINIMYGLLVLLEIATNFTVGITSVSTIMSIIKANRRPRHPTDLKPLLSNAICILISSSLLITMIIFCQMTTWKSKKLANIINNISLKYPLKLDTLQQLKLFTSQICYNSFEFTAFWLFRLDSNLLCTIFASAVTYTAVLAQLNP